MERVYSNYTKLLQPYIALEAKKGVSLQSETDFENAVDYLKEHVKLRKTWTERYLQSQEFQL